ncbi:MAG: heme biosynthesis protein HemY, partial [Mesorhizobium sp.]
ANRLRPGFEPAAATAARALFRNNDVRKGSKILEAAWKAEPHPEIADLYLHARPGDAALDRLHRARKLQDLRKNNAESAMAVARAALDAQEFAEARRSAEAAIRIDRREGAYLLLADIEEAETGDQGKVRQLLAKAVRAPRDPAWVADGVISERWAPVSPVTGRLDAFEWRAPVERLGQLIESDEAEAGAPVLAAPVMPAAPKPSPATVDAGEDDAGEVMAPVTAAERAAAPAEAEEPEEAPGLPTRLPDDPGIDPEEAEMQEKTANRFRLF